LGRSWLKWPAFATPGWTRPDATEQLWPKLRLGATSLQLF
jgi:hypothetical protein